MCLVMRMLERGVCCLRWGCIVPGFAGRGGRRDVVNYYQGSGVAWGRVMVWLWWYVGV